METHLMYSPMHSLTHQLFHSLGRFSRRPLTHPFTKLTCAITQSLNYPVDQVTHINEWLNQVTF